MITGATFAVSRRAILPFQGLVGMPNTKGLRITNRHENAARVALDVIGNGRNRIFVFRPKARTYPPPKASRSDRLRGVLGRKVLTGFGCVRKYFSPSVFRGPVKIRDKLSLKIRDKGDRTCPGVYPFFE